MPLREPPVPALLVGAVSHEGRMVTLAVVRVHWRNEGTCILERLSADGSHTDVVVNGTWRIVGDDDNVLDVDDRRSRRHRELPRLHRPVHGRGRQDRQGVAARSVSAARQHELTARSRA